MSAPLAISIGLIVLAVITIGVCIDVIVDSRYIIKEEQK